MENQGGESIRIMPASLANKIAAGEVVVRPAAALKELLENAVDANATSIDVEIKGAGSLQILVRDDGVGMGPGDAVRCFSRHATSKIRSLEELDQIWTLGFRGEALAAVAAVSQVTLKTRRQSDGQGHLVRIHGGEVQASEPCAAATGTTISVRNLFYNVPARRAFLKSPATEFSHITDAFLSLALANPHLAFSLTHDGSRVYRLPAQTQDTDGLAPLRGRIARVFGAAFARRLIDVHETTDYISAYGLVCRAEQMRRSRRERFLYVNGRIVRSTSLQHAVMSAYEGMMPARRYPFYVLFLALNPIHVDVNVHPAKTEVRFDNERDAYGFLRAVVRKALGTADLVPQFRSEESGRLQARDADVVRYSTVLRSESSGRARAGQLSDTLYAPAKSASQEPSTESKEAVPQLWQLYNRYICAPLRTGLMVLDQRAAHERILYEQSLSTLASGAGHSQQLLFTETTELNARDMALFDELNPILVSLGFHVDKYSGRTVVVRGVPQGLRSGTERFFLRDVLAEFRNNAEQAQFSPQENLARSVARSGAIKAGTALTPEEMSALIDDLFRCQDPYTAPNGHPVLIKISRNELKRRFAKAPS